MVKRVVTVGLFAGYVACVYGANWAIQRYGVVPIGLGLYAPAGVFFAGLVFSLRDWLQESGGRLWVVAAILVGAALSALLSGPLALASAVAFLVSELLDYAVYTPLHKRSWIGAVVLSNTVGTVVDSALFLVLAFGSLDYLSGQVVGKLYMTALAVALMLVYRTSVQRRNQLQIDA